MHVSDINLSNNFEI